MESICKSLNGIYLAIHPLAAIEPDALTILKLLEEELQAIMAELEQTVEKEPQVSISTKKIPFHTEMRPEAL